MATPEDLRRRATLLRRSAMSQLRAARVARTASAVMALRASAIDALRQATSAEMAAAEGEAEEQTAARPPD